MKLLDGKVALVTGAGRGLGRFHALALARAGAAVLVNDVGASTRGRGADNGPAEAVVAEIRTEGGAARGDTHDISAWDGAAGLIDATLAAFGRLDIVVNNAGISRPASLADVTEADYDLEVGVHLKGVVALSHFAARHWRETGPAAGRAIVNTTSPVGLHPIPDNGVYIAAKSAVTALTQAHAQELAGLGVRVNAVAPCGRTRLAEADPLVLGQMPIVEGFDRHAPEHVAPLVVYLASDLCPFTGRVFGIEGPDLLVYDPWHGAHPLHRPLGWTPETLADGLKGTPLQTEVLGLYPGGPVLLRSPPNRTLRALDEISARA